MKLPAVAIAAAFACGIATGVPGIHLTVSVLHPLLWTLSAAALLLACSSILLSRSLSAAGVTSLFAWFALGISGAVISHQAKPANYVLNLADARALDLHTPLRWHGRLRDEPGRLPWGVALDALAAGGCADPAHRPERRHSHCYRWQTIRCVLLCILPPNRR